MSLPVLADPAQRFACRDCPARCCRLPARVIVLPDEKDRLQALDWVQERLSRLQTSFILQKGGWCLPVVESDRLPQCAFLDPDGLCSIHKREGAEATPLTCRTFPFGFIQEPEGLRPYLSHLCPSIRDNYGEPLTPQWESKLSFLPPPISLAPHMTVGLHALEPPAFLS